ncbi:MAG: GNAT family N-acetyltransferase [Gemmatimonadetes bacterium]|nr:GNAT family N-acetyltransferase [Gemmatimonadota bacterium]
MPVISPLSETPPPIELENAWVPTSFRLEFFFGEYLLKRLDLGAVEPDCFFLDLPEDPEALVRKAPSRTPVVVPSLPAHLPMSRLAFSGGRIRYLVYRFPRYLVRFHETFDGYMGSLSSKTRYAVRKAIRKVAEDSDGAFEMREYHTPEDVRPFLRSAAAVSALTYQTKLLKAGLSDDELTRSSLISRAQAGEFWSFVLWVRDQPISYMLGTTRGRIYRQDHGGYDPAFHHLDPGRALHGMALEHLHDSGKIDMLDFTPGGGAHKEKLSTEAVDCVDLVYFPLGPKAVLLVGSHLLLQGLSRMIVRSMETLGLKTRIKQLLRGRQRGRKSAAT